VAAKKGNCKSIRDDGRTSPAFAAALFVRWLLLAAATMRVGDRDRDRTGARAHARANEARITSTELRVIDARESARARPRPRPRIGTTSLDPLRN